MSRDSVASGSAATETPPGDGATRWMARALELAARARGETSPNPMVGAVIVRGDEVLGEGWHHRAGGPHAEIEALSDAARRGADVRGATMFVTLEPCCHTGRTGPCTKAVIAAGIGRVVVAADDPNPLVAGQGVAELEAAGIAVERGVLAAAARELNRIFMRWIPARAPFVTLKLAMSLDGRIARRAGERTTVTGALAQRRVMELRAEHDAVLVGRRTAEIDRPRLTVRGLPSADEARSGGPNPWRVVVDSRLELPRDLPLWSGAPGAIALTALAPTDPRVAVWQADGVEVVCAPGAGGQVDLVSALDVLGRRERPLTSVLCEGGGAVAASLLAAGRVDELILHVAPTFFGADGVPAVGALDAVVDGFERVDTRPLGADLELRYRPRTARAGGE